MKYYFSLSNKDVKDFVSSSGRCIVILTNHTGCNEHFECIFIRKNDTQTIYTIDLGSTDYRNYVTYDGYISLKEDQHRFAFVKLHMCDDFGGNAEESYHYYHFAVNLKEKLRLTRGKDEPVKSIKIVDILKNNGSTIEFSLYDEKMAFRPDGTIYYVYSVKIPDKYLESCCLQRDSFTKLLHLSDIARNYDHCVAVIMYRSINGPKGLKDSMGLEIRQPSLKNMWQPEAKPWEWINTAPVNITPYVKAELSTMYGFMEVMKNMSMFESDKRVRIPEIKEVIFNYPATIVCWKDGTKTIVKCGEDEASFDREKAVAMCFIKKMLKPSAKSHWLDIVHNAIQAADDKIAQIEADKAEKARIKAENIAKAEEARRKKAEKKAKELQSEIQKLETKSLEEMNKVEGKDEFEEKYKDVPVKPSKNEVSKEYVEKIFDQAVKEGKKWAEQTNNKGKKNKIDVDVMVDCIKEDLSIDEIAEMNSWDKSAVARMYYKITGTRPEKKTNTYSELDELFEKGVSIDAATRRTGFSKNIVAMRYAKLQNKKNKE